MFAERRARAISSSFAARSARLVQVSTPHTYSAGPLLPPLPTSKALSLSRTTAYVRLAEKVASKNSPRKMAEASLRD